MASVTALILFDQGGPGTPGQVFVGFTGSLVTVTNDDNTNVNSWQIDLVYTPPGSSVPVATPLAFNDADSTPTASFTPTLNIPGSYRVVLTVWAVVNRIGTNYDVDIRNFVIVSPNGLVVPPYMKDPDKLPTLASGRPGAKPNEMNINGTELGWAGDGTDGLLAQAIALIGGAGGAGGGISWRPDGSGDATTFADVMAVVTASKSPVTIYLSQYATHVIDPGPPGPQVIYDMKGARFVATNGPHDNIIVQIRRFATLHNLAGIEGGMRLQHNHFVADGPLPVLTFTPGITPVFTVAAGATMQGLTNAEIPILEVTSAYPEFYLVFNELGTAHYLPTTVSPATVFVYSGAGLNVVTLSGGLGIDSPQNPSWLGSDLGTTINWIHDGSMWMDSGFWTQHVNLLGTQVNQALGQNGGVGPTAYRPTYQGGGPPSDNCLYLNTDYGAGGATYEYYSGTLFGWLHVSGRFVEHAGIVAGNQNDWSPGSYWQQTTVCYISSTGAIDVTGLEAPSVTVSMGTWPNYRKMIINEGAFNITFKNLSGASLGINQLRIAGGDFVLVPDGSFELEYDTAIARWRAV